MRPPSDRMLSRTDSSSTAAATMVVMDVRRVTFGEAEEARGVVVVIDVIRAFTVAAYAFAGGAGRLWLVRTTDEALALRDLEPDALLAGEIRGRLIPGFDLNNSPALVRRAAMGGKLIIQRTGAGTQAAVRARHADHLLICTLPNARATAEHARRLALDSDEPITVLPTADGGLGGRGEAIEDDICADYIEALLCERPAAAEELAAGITRLRDSGRLHGFTADDSDMPADDVPLFLATDRFDFAMLGRRRETDGIQYVEVRRRDLNERRTQDS